jgi:hypothetical protein
MADRRRLHDQRQREGLLVVPLVVGPPLTDYLARHGYLAGHSLENRDQIARALQSLHAAHP